MDSGRSQTLRRELANTILARLRKYSIWRAKGGDPLSEDERDKILEVVDATLNGTLPLATSLVVAEHFKQVNNNRNSDYNMIKWGVDANKKAALRRSLETISNAVEISSEAKKRREAERASLKERKNPKQ